MADPSPIAPWIPVIVTVVATMGAAIVYLWQKRADRKNELLLQRRKAYTELLVALNRHLTHQCLPNLTKLNEKRAEVFLVASDKVAKSTGLFFEQAKKVSDEVGLQGTANNPKKVLDHYAEMVLAMRTDCFEKSKLDIAAAVECMPIYYSDETERTTIK